MTVRRSDFTILKTVLASVLQVSGPAALPDGGKFPAVAASPSAADNPGGGNAVLPVVVPGGKPTNTVANGDYVPRHVVRHVARQVENLSHRAHDAVLQSLDPRAAAGKDAVAWSAIDGSWSHAQSHKKHDSLDSAVDAVIAILGRTST